MIKEKYETLIRKLFEATGEGKIEWEETSSKNEYLTKIGNSAVSIGFYDPDDLTNSFYYSPSGAAPELFYYLSIFNSDGKLIDNETMKESDPDFETMKTLYQEVRRAYYKVDKTLDDILNNL